MKVELVKEYRFEAAHRLPAVPPGHKCARLHGHSFKFEIHVVGPVDERTGWFIDYGVLDDAVMPLVAQLDHYYMNEISSYTLTMPMIRAASSRMRANALGV